MQFSLRNDYFLRHTAQTAGVTRWRGLGRPGTLWVPPQILLFPRDCAAGYPLGVAQSRGKRVSWRDCIPPNLPTEWPLRTSCQTGAVVALCADKRTFTPNHSGWSIPCIACVQEEA